MLPKCSSPLIFIDGSSDVFKLLILEGFLTCRSNCTLRVCPASLSHRCGEEGPRVQEEWLCPPYSLTVAFEGALQAATHTRPFHLSLGTCQQQRGSPRGSCGG